MRHPHLKKLGWPTASRRSCRRRRASPREALCQVGGNRAGSRPPFWPRSAARIATGEAAAVGHWPPSTSDVASGDLAPAHDPARAWCTTTLGERPPGSIVVLLRQPPEKFAAADAVPEIVEGLRAASYELRGR